MKTKMSVMVVVASFVLGMASTAFGQSQSASGSWSTYKEFKRNPFDLLATANQSELPETPNSYRNKSSFDGTRWSSRSTQTYQSISREYRPDGSVVIVVDTTKAAYASSGRSEPYQPPLYVTESYGTARAGTVYGDPVVRPALAATAGVINSIFRPAAGKRK